MNPYSLTFTVSLWLSSRMSRHFIGLSKLSPWNHSLIHKRRFRLFSSSLTTPYLTLGTALKNDLPDGSDIRDIILFDPGKEEILTIPGQTFPEELVDSRQIGSANGWGVFTNDSDHSLCISDIYNPLASKSNPTMIPLPSLVAALHSNQIWNVAMSSSSPCDEDCVVAIKFLGKQLSLCRPHSDIRWTNLGEILVDEKLENLENSNLMYSKRDQRFYLPGPGGDSLYSWDLHHLKKNKKKSPKLHELLFRDLPELDESEWKLLGWCCRTEHLVESASSGERFLVKWYAQRVFSLSDEGINYMTKRFMVFREKTTSEGSYMYYYTEDIGDLCIFLSISEAFCVGASSCTGLKPNSIYFIGHGFGIYNLADTTLHLFEAPEGAPDSFKDPYWLPPFCI